MSQENVINCEINIVILTKDYSERPKNRRFTKTLSL